MARIVWGALAAVAAIAALACAPGGPEARAQAQVAAGDLDGARASLERERERRPRDADVRIALGEVYYRIARDALDGERDETRYLAFLERSVDEFVTALEIEPRDSRPHFYLGMMDLYRGEPRRALGSFQNALRLEPSGLAYTNIAETYIYLGQIREAQRWTDLGLRNGAPYAVRVFNEMLMDWRQGDLERARHDFAWLRSSRPELLRTINEARLPEPPSRFEDFAAYCCRSPGCGPYMKPGCESLSLEVREREISNEAILRELQLEMEAKRRLRKVYQDHKELDIRMGDEPPGE